MASEEIRTSKESKEKTQTLPYLYEHSSQYRNWRFSRSQLAQIRVATNTTTIQHLQMIMEEENKESNSTDTTKPQAYLTPEEELKLSVYFQKRLFDAGKHALGFPESVCASAVIYMKRFFLYNSVMDYPPHEYILVCLFLATKSENERMTLDEFVAKSHYGNPGEMMSREFVISQGIKFEYRIHHPYSSSKGFFLDIQTVTDDMQKLNQTYDRVTSLIHETLLTDLPFIYHPSQIALACFWIAAKETSFDIQSYLDIRLSDQLSMLKPIFDDVEKDIIELKILNKEEATDIDRKRLGVINPAKNPNSAVYKKRELERERAEDEKRLKKARSNDPAELEKIMH